MKRIMFLFILIAAGVAAFPQGDKGKMMPVTTGSKQALTLYKQSMNYFDAVNLPRALETMKKALEEDPGFFMANYQLAFYYRLNQAPEEFEMYSDAAVSSKAKLSEPEELLKSVLVKLREGSTDVTELGKKLIEKYPNDPDSYNNMAYFQSLAGDSDGMVETLNMALKVTSNPAPVYNQLGYAYLTLKENDKAEAAFNKYIELEPGNPNVYDSKGDFFMYVKKYDKAYESYMKAYSMDPSFSREKAQMAKQIYEQTEGRKMDIITM